MVGSYRARQKPFVGGLLRRVVVCGVLVATAVGGASGVGPAPVSAAPAAAPVVFPGPSLGVAGTQRPLGPNFARHCNSYLTTTPKQVGGTTVPAGTATENTGCGQAVLYLNRPRSGRLQAHVGVSADETNSAPMLVRVRVVDASGYVTRGLDVTVSKGSGPKAIDIGVGGAAAVAFDFKSGPNVILYDVTLSGAAQALVPAGGSGDGLPVGAVPINLSGAARSCNAYLPTAPISVTLVGLAMNKAVTASGCGEYTVGIERGTRGTLVLRYGAIDDTDAAKRGTLTVRVLDANGHIVRKAVGMTFAGGGLRPMWVDLRGGVTINFKVDGSVNIAITGAGILPYRVAPAYQNPQRTLFGGAPGGVAVDGPTFVSRCNAYNEDADVTVAGQLAVGGTYVSLTGCGSTRLVLGGNASGLFHATFGVPDNAQGGAQPRLKVIATAKDNAPLLQRTYAAPYGTPGVPIDVPLSYGNKHVSVISFVFLGGASISGVLYGMRLTGNATAYSVAAAPVDPPVVPPGGTAISPYSFALDCNAYINKDADTLLLHEAALQDWAISFSGCGSASLNLAGLPYPHRAFQARIGIEAGQDTNTLVKVSFNLLNSAGTIIRHVTVPVRYGYGPLPSPPLDLRGGAKLQITREGSFGDVIVYAMTLR
ncbi:MAG: hypothetical protein NVSMB65_06640 [Chloroflexota bacterium]